MAVIAPEDVNAVQDAIAAARDDRTSFDVTYTVRSRTGTEHWVQMRGSWEFDDRGAPVSIFGIALDADDRMHSEQQLAESERRLQEAQAAGGVGVWEFDMVNRAAHVSDEYLRMHGFDDVSYSLAHYREYVPEEDLEMQAAALERVRKTPGEEYDVEHRIIHAKTGEIRWVHGRGTGKFDAHGNCIGLIGTSQDITERKQAEAALHERTRVFQTLTRASPTLIFQFDESGSATFINNDRWREFSGRPDRAWVGSGWLDALHPDDHSKASRQWFRAMEARTPFQGEFRWQHTSGNVRWLLMHVLPVSSDEGFSGFVGTGMDVTALKESEEERAILQVALANSQKMEAIGTLASGVAHDFNNLLAAVRGYVELAAMELDTTHQAAGFLDKAQSAIDQARDVTSGLLTFARRNPTDLQVIALNELVAENVDFLRKLVPASISIGTGVGDEPAFAYADAPQIRQVLVNLVINARDAMPNGGHLQVDLKVRGDQAVITVADTGHGMDEAITRRAFEPFFTTKAQGQGTGLGLSIVHGIVQAHEGTIDIESVPGRGTRIEVRLPLTDRPATEPEHEPRSVRPGTGQRILIVEDNTLVRESLLLRLRAGGYEAVATNDGRSALASFDAAIAADAPFAAILMDVDLPGDNGVAVAHEMQRRQPATPMFYITGNVLNNALREVDPSTILAKPVDFGELRARLDSALPA